MKTKALLVLISAALLGVGCAQSKKSSGGANEPVAQPVLPAYIPGAPGYIENNYSNNTWTQGGTATLNIVSDYVFNRWVQSHPVEPENVLINVNVGEVPNRGTYAGEVKIRYTHNGQEYEATLKSGTQTYEGVDDYTYNKFFQFEGKEVFSGFFEDNYGAIVLVVDKNNDLGDGGGATEVGGSIWFKNFTVSRASYYEGASWSVVLPCWFRSIGPYNCQSSTVINKSGLYPDGGYEKLGSFNGLNVIKAFNLDQ